MAATIPIKFWQRAYWQKWLRTAKTTGQIATLGVRQIYILPTRWGLIYAFMLLALLVGSINYSLSLGYYVTFLLASLGNIAMLHTWRNLVHLQIEVLHAKPVFAGEDAEVSVRITEPKNHARYTIVAHFSDNTIDVNDITANNTQLFLLPLSTQKRGWLKAPRITFYTAFPLSLFHAWGYVDSPFQLLVYAKPSEANYLQAPTIDAGTEGSNTTSKGDDDFYGHKTYQIGDAPSRVDWKASSRGVGMLSKQYSGTGESTLWLDWENTEGTIEARISQLTRGVIDAHLLQKTYGLRLPSLTLAPSNTDAHYHQALSALALLT